MEIITLDGIPPSAEIRAGLRGTTQILSFSRGKDSIAAWLAMRDAGINVVAFHLYRIPGLRFVDESIAYYEDYFGTKIIQLPHPALWRLLDECIYQPPERVRTLEACQLIQVTYDDIDAAVRDHYGLPDAYVHDGVRACDNPTRRTAMIKHGPVSERRKKMHIVWDWKVSAVRETIAAAGCKLPPDYEWFKRSFDGYDYRFTEPLSRYAPDDYARLLEWFPLADLDIMRRRLRKPAVI